MTSQFITTIATLLLFSCTISAETICKYYQENEKIYKKLKPLTIIPEKQFKKLCKNKTNKENCKCLTLTKFHLNQGVSQACAKSLTLSMLNKLIINYQNMIFQLSDINPKNKIGITLGAQVENIITVRNDVAGMNKMHTYQYEDINSYHKNINRLLATYLQQQNIKCP